MLAKCRLLIDDQHYWQLVALQQLHFEISIARFLVALALSAYV